KACVLPENPASYRVVRTKSYLFNKAWHNLNLRQHLARLGRKSLSFSKSVELHDKVIGHYLNIKHYQ
ncbi:IS1 family transposase, partial [Escherichia coli]|uniref:IS1 family transposase n=1 Tax=Escherichia coli TaxID=562 RepID=UPI001F49ED54